MVAGGLLDLPAGAPGEVLELFAHAGSLNPSAVPPHAPSRVGEGPGRRHRGPCPAVGGSTTRKSHPQFSPTVPETGEEDLSLAGLACRSCAPVRMLGVGGRAEIGPRPPVRTRKRSRPLQTIAMVAGGADLGRSLSSVPTKMQAGRRAGLAAAGRGRRRAGWTPGRRHHRPTPVLHEPRIAIQKGRWPRMSARNWRAFEGRPRTACAEEHRTACLEGARHAVGRATRDPRDVSACSSTIAAGSRRCGAKRWGSGLTAEAGVPGAALRRCAHAARPCDPIPISASG